MANSSKREDSSPLERIVRRQDFTISGMSSASSSPSSSDETERINRPGNNPGTFGLSKRTGRSRIGTDHTTGPDLPRREENPFSFKHFLQNEPQTNYQLAGARPKVYSPPVISPEPPALDTETPGVYPRNPTELPDFVQDHLVIEQCYLNHEAAVQPIVDVENLPDFALNSVEQRQSRHWAEPKKCKSEVLGDLPFDLTGTLDRGRRERSVPSAVPQGPLDLPAFDRPNNEPIERPDSIGFPFDLQLPLAESDPNNSSAGARSCPSSSEANVTKSLPDFLSDGPIRTRPAPTPDLGPGSSTPEPTDRRLILENERLRHDLEIIRRQNDERARRIQLLETELATRRAVDHEETAHLEKAMEQVEDNLKRSTRRAVNAESTVTALKQEVKVLSTEISVLRAENRELRAGTGAGYGVNAPASLDGRIRRLAKDLKTAASTAELSLRQLMSGVDNLRVIASALENADRIEDRTKDFLPDFEEDNASGPAL